MFARFTVAYEKHENALLVPESALIVEDDEITVYVMNGGGEVTRRIIETGVTADSKVQVLAGLEDHDEIVLVGHGGLRDGSKVLASNRVEESFTG